MKKLFLVFWVFFLLVGIVSAILNITPQYSNIKNFNFVYFTPTDAEATFISQHLDLMVYTGSYKSQFRASNPDLQVWSYDTCMSMGVLAPINKLATVWPICTSQYSAAFCEGMFFHLARDATITSINDGVNTPVKGWNPADDTNGDGIRDIGPSDPQRTALFKNESRIPSWSIYQRWTNFNHTFWSDYCSNTTTDDFSWGTSEFDGIMLDEVTADVPPNIPSGNYFVELNPADQSADYISKATIFLSTFCDKAHAKGKYCGVNGPFDKYSSVVDVDFNEFIFTYQQELAWYQMNSQGDYTTKPYTSDNYWRMNIAKRSSPVGVSEMLQYQGNDFATWPCGQTFDSVPRDQNYFLSLYYMMKDSNSFFSWWPVSCSATYNCRTPSQIWFGAREVDIGQPVGDFYIINGTNINYNNNPGGYYGMFVRNYTKGMVYTLPRPHWQSCIGDTTYNTINLPGTYQVVNNDGSLGAPTNQIQLRWKEGAVLLKSGPSSDVNSDGKINVKDLAIVIFNQGRTPTGNYANLDLDSDSKINWNDVQIVANNM
ncbi:MAG: dockerin type I domain-containing protein [Nanoarchaeota archaeon]